MPRDDLILALIVSALCHVLGAPPTGTNGHQFRRLVAGILAVLAVVALLRAPVLGLWAGCRRRRWPRNGRLLTDSAPDARPHVL